MIPITTDGISLPEFPESHPDQGQALRLKVTVEPALFTADPHTHRIIPVSYELLSEDDYGKGCSRLPNNQNHRRKIHEI